MTRDWVPMRWPAAWRNPARLELLRGTPVNCLVGESPPPFPLGDIRFVGLDALESSGISVREGVWPAVQSSRDREFDTAEAGPTGAPWVDSNSWLIRLAQTLEPGKQVWLTHTPPGSPDVVGAADYTLPVAEAEAYGARWVIGLDEVFSAALAEGSESAVGGWKRMMEVIEFSDKHPDWRTWKPIANLAVVSDFEGANEFLGGEFLNLAQRRQLAYRIVPKEEAAEASFRDQRAVLFIDGGPPEGKILKNLLEFVREGGLLICPAGFPSSDPQGEQNGYHLHNIGGGRVAVPQEEWADPYLLAGEVHLLMSHRHDVVRIWNGRMLNAHYVSAGEGNRAVVHLISYSRRSELEEVTLGFAEPYREAEFHTLDSSETIIAVRRRLGVELALPPFSTYAAIELRG